MFFSSHLASPPTNICTAYPPSYGSILLSSENLVFLLLLWSFLLSFFFWPESDHPLTIGVPQSLALSSLYLPFLLLHSHGFKNHLYANNSQIYISSLISPQCFFLIYPNYLLDNSMWMFLKHLKLNMNKTKLLLFPMETYFSTDLLYLSKRHLILSGCWNKKAVWFSILPLPTPWHAVHSQNSWFAIRVRLVFRYYCDNPLTGTLPSVLPLANTVVRVVFLKCKWDLFTSLLTTHYYLCALSDLVIPLELLGCAWPCPCPCSLAVVACALYSLVIGFAV